MYDLVFKDDANINLLQGVGIGQQANITPRPGRTVVFQYIHLKCTRTAVHSLFFKAKNAKIASLLAVYLNLISRLLSGKQPESIDYGLGRFCVAMEYKAPCTIISRQWWRAPGRQRPVEPRLWDAAKW